MIGGAGFGGANRVIPGLIPILVAASCASSGGLPAVQDLAGCYYFERDAGAEEMRLPWGIRLREASLVGWPAMSAREGVREATTLTGRSEDDHPFGYWTLSQGDSLEVGYPGGGGLVLRVTVDDHDLSGTVRAVGDVRRPGEPRTARPDRPVRLIWARCPED